MMDRPTFADRWKPLRAKISLVLVLVVFSLVLAVAFWLAQEPVAHPAAYLPVHTVFYYQQSVDLNWVKEYKFLENIFLAGQRDLIKDMLRADAAALKSYLWFKTADLVESTNIILELSQPVQPLLRRLSQDHPQYYYKELSRQIFLISDHKSILGQVNPDNMGNFSPEYFKSGINIYARGDQSWPMLEPLVGWWQAWSGGQDFFSSFYGSADRPIIKLWSSSPSDDTKERTIDGNSLAWPPDLDLALAFNQPLTSGESLFIKNQLWAALAQVLPREIWSLSQAEFLSPEIALAEKDESWLLAGLTDWRSSLADLASRLEYREEPQVLSDGTSYMELVTKDDSPLVSKQHGGRDYWQWSDLFGTQDQTYYYLSNDEAWVRGILEQNASRASWLNICDIEKEANVSNLLIINRDKIPGGSLKSYLEAANFNFVGFFNYFKDNIEFWQFCGQK